MKQRVGFKMKLFKGHAEEYQRRHDHLWPELKMLLTENGIQEYSIFLDEATHELFAYLTIDDAQRIDQLPDHPVMQKWWDYMKDIMETNADHSPVSTPLKEVFYMP